MKAIEPIYNDCPLRNYTFAFDSEHIAACVYSIIYTNLQSKGPNDRHVMPEVLANEADNWIVEEIGHTDVLAMLYEIKQWANCCNYSYEVIGIDDLKTHLKFLDIKSKHTREYFRINKAVKVHVGIDAFLNLKDLLEFHWSRIMYGWNYEYDFGMTESDAFIKLGPIEIKIDSNM